MPEQIISPPLEKPQPVLRTSLGPVDYLVTLSQSNLHAPVEVSFCPCGYVSILLFAFHGHRNFKRETFRFFYNFNSGALLNTPGYREFGLWLEEKDPYSDDTDTHNFFSDIILFANTHMIEQGVWHDYSYDYREDEEES